MRPIRWVRVLRHHGTVCSGAQPASYSTATGVLFKGVNQVQCDFRHLRFPSAGIETRWYYSFVFSVFALMVCTGLIHFTLAAEIL